MTVVDVDEITSAQHRFRDGARALLGVAGDRRLPSLRDAVASSGAGWFPLAALGGLALTDELVSFAMIATGPELGRALGIGRGAVAFLVVLKTLAVLAAALPVAALVHRGRSRGTITAVAAAVWSVATVVAAFTIDVGGLLLAMVAYGAAAAAIVAVHTPLLADTYPAEVRVRVLSAYRAAGVIGAVAGPVVVAVVSVALGFTWRGVLLAAGGLGLAAAAVAARLRDPGFGRWDAERVRAAVRSEANGAAGPAGDEAPLTFGESVRRVTLVPTVRRLFVANALIGTMLLPLQSFVLLALDERWDVGPGGRLAFLAAAAALAVPALVVFGRRGEVALRQGPGDLLDLSARALAVAVAGLVVTVVSPVLAGAFVGVALVLASLFVTGPALLAVAFAVVPARLRSQAAALLGIAVVGVGGVGGALFLDGIDRRFGVAWAIVSLAAPATIAALVLRRAARGAGDDLDRVVDELVEQEELRVLSSRGLHVPMLSCRHVDFSYGQLQVLFDVDFTVDDGEMVALLGTNGAGKSTLLRVISGLGLPSRGSVTFGGTDITYLDAERRLGIGITQIPGGKATFGPLSVVENLRVFGHSLGRGDAAVAAGLDATFEAFPRLAERRNQLASTLSGGEQQMLALGKAFILRPRLLLIDELSLGLAPKVVGELLGIVRRINAGGTAVVLVEQSVNIALSLVDHAYFMEKGQIRFDGPAADLLERRDLLRSVFLEGATKGLAT